jgi:hypothetical protein
LLHQKVGQYPASRGASDSGGQPDKGGIALCCAGGARELCLQEEPVAVVHLGVAEIGEFAFLSIVFAKQLRIGIGG